jgi:hypothetical protein
MPQTIETFTVHLAEPPTGIFRDALARSEIDILGQALTRLNQISGLLFMMKTSEEIAPGVAAALAGIETLVDDTAGLLTVIPMRGAA